jgi:hypothetical protein
MIAQIGCRAWSLLLSVWDWGFEIHVERVHFSAVQAGIMGRSYLKVQEAGPQRDVKASEDVHTFRCIAVEQYRHPARALICGSCRWLPPG